jgi:anti-sigma B factor antagonist
MDKPQSAQLTIQVVHLNAAPVVMVTGELDLSTADILRRSLEPLGGRVVVNLAGVSFMGCSGIGVLVAAHNRLAADGGGLRLRSPRDHVRRTLELVGLGDWIVRDAPRSCTRRAARRSRHRRAVTS